MQNTSQPIDLNQLFSTVYTKEDLLIFYKEIDQLIALLFTGPGELSEKMDQVVAADKKKSLLYYLGATNTRLDNLVDIKEALSKVERLGNALPVVTLELAFEPTESIIKTISYWFVKRIQTKVILDFTLERRIIGGAYVAVNGTYKDYTLQTKINKYFAVK